jgi:hypothetical protein
MAQSNPDSKVSHIAMWIIAATLLLCLALVILVEGIDTVPHGWIGAGVTVVLAIGAVLMTRIHFEVSPPKR